ncbi:GMC family oxidoreductase [Achromobacter xylosoxidans]|uniref:GMC family oxidoreductase n=1 Tax=Achromobacter TaxID=222 RepID=UPI0008A32148|nr:MULTISPECIES: GMC oxidoreductase [Achromobacter]MCH4579986.1 GMC family oxidoreductase N-terminal domain-containing protein [Achromobacter xylosoxidans]OFU72925.1 glucose-methanol-choline oxidoreductase [Achromobacter xylosoxidans]PWY43185.1 glucose-methanol-choline oxidoreductase [Achromobacter sp. RW408]
MNSEKYDVVIVGAGAAGCTVAAYIAENSSASIALLEAGGMDTDPLIHIPAGFAKILAYDLHVWKYETIPLFGTRRHYRMGKVLGGGSSINAMAYVRGQARDYDAWQIAVGDTGSWSYKDLLPHFIAQEDNKDIHNEYHGDDGGLKVQIPRRINALNQYCVDAFLEYGLPYNPDYNGKSQIGVCPVQATINTNVRCSAVDAFLRNHIKSGRISLLTHKTITRVLVENGRALGVEFFSGDSVKKILSDRVILSAGAVQSPKILMHSGIGAAEQLKQHGIEVKVDSPDVGEHLHDHSTFPVRAYVKGALGYQAAAHGFGAIKVGLRYLVTREGPAAGNGIETVSYWNPADFTAPPTIQCYHTPVIAHGGLVPTGNRSGITLELVLLQPRSRGWVRLADGDPMSMPLINPNYLADSQDIQEVVQAIRATREVMKQKALAGVVEEEADPGIENQTDAQLAKWAKGITGTMWHPVGTCRMGGDDRAVVDARLRVRGVDNLRVIDASIMPRIISGNTNAPTMALARHGAAMFVADELK